jgi:hypothetical protein
MNWEYKAVGLGLTGLNNQLNEIGLQGWELVSISKSGIGVENLLAIFKRPLP